MLNEQLGAKSPLVSVVIPTIGRNELLRAVKSVLEQSISSEILVISDRLEKLSTVQAMLAGLNVKVIQNKAKGSPAARNLGVNLSKGKYIAFLDDDDVFLPGKLEVQLDELEKLSGPRFSVCGSEYRQKSGRTKKNVRRKFKGNGALGDYLLERKWPWIGTPIFTTSSLVIDRETIHHVKWDESLPCHQDVDLFIRLAKIRNIFIHQSRSPLVGIQQGSHHSITWTRQIEDNFNFLTKHHGVLGSRTVSDFITTNIIARNFRAHDLKSARKNYVDHCPGIPHFGSTIRALASWWLD